MHVLIGYEPMVYCASKLIENLKFFYKSNRPHFLWVYWRDDPLGMLGDYLKACKSFVWARDLQAFLVLCQQTHRKCGLLL